MKKGIRRDQDGYFTKNWYKGEDIVRDKERAINTYINDTLKRTNEMFKWNNCPDTLDTTFLELYLQTDGLCAVKEVKGNLYALFGNLGGEPNAYYVPKDYIVANPYLNYFTTLESGKDCVVIWNDSLYQGILPIIKKYSYLLAEADITLLCELITNRSKFIMSANDDRTQQSAIKFLSDMEAGKSGVIGDDAIFEALQVTPVSAHNGTISAIEARQYIKANLYNDLGLNANYNMKREAINGEEAGLNDDMLIPLIDNMLRYRQKGADEINKMYGTNISVELNSAWLDNQLELDYEQENLKNGGNDNETKAGVSAMEQ